MSRGVFLNTQVVGALEKRPFPVKAPVALSRGQGVEREIHAAHVKRTHLGPRRQRACHAFLQRHHRAAAGGDVDHRVAASRDTGQEAHEMLHPCRWSPVLRIAGVQMQDRRAGLGRRHRLVLDIPCRERQVRRQARRVDRAGDSAGDDDPGHHARPPRNTGALPPPRAARAPSPGIFPKQKKGGRGPACFFCLKISPPEAAGG